ncbi:uncharacterized protein LOC125179505 [Hyalella azteca]|uniref:Uncharacterized protein LOC125179505 n=1 Tax=Hyalella azteca TaxID=294128 RepID=A0A979FY28_HYAAZ|nr:uncharacterized protein LOC125179505 [Hyalella azteca]
MELSTYMPAYASLTEGLTAVQSITEAHDVAVKVKCEVTAACSVPVPEICAVYIKEELKEDWDDISFKEEPVFPEDDEHGRKIKFCTSKRSSKNVEASDDLTGNERVVEDTADGDEKLLSEVVTADANGRRNLLTPSVGRSKRSKPKPSKRNAAGISKLSPAGRVSEFATDGREKPALKGTAGDITSVDRLSSAKKVRKDSAGGKNLSSSDRFAKDSVTSVEVPELAELVVGTADSCELCARAAAAEEINGSNDNSEASGTKPYMKQHSSKQNLNLQHSSTLYHECPDCEYHSKFKYQLQLHILAKHSAGKLFQCPDCQNEYFTKRTFRHHILLKHSSEQLEHSVSNQMNSSNAPL